MNALKTGVLLTGLTLIIVWLGQHFGGVSGMVMAFGFALVMNAVSYWFSDKIVLAAYGAKAVSEDDAPGLYSLMYNLTARAGLPMPKLYMIPTDMPNAFATGRDPEHAAVAVTTGLMNILNRDEIEGVISHELAHVKNRDILISTIAATLAGAIMILARIAQFAAIFGGGSRDDDRGGGIGLLAAAIVAPIAALLVQMAISRSREYQADETGANICGNPLGLASALSRLDAVSRRVPADISPATAHMFIVNPLNGGGLINLFSTHPPIEDRINRLNAMAHNTGTLYGAQAK